MMDEYNLTLIIMGSLSAAIALGWWVGATVERDKWRRRAQISWQLRREQTERVKL
jgi:hypothetical protein